MIIELFFNMLVHINVCHLIKKKINNNTDPAGTVDQIDKSAGKYYNPLPLVTPTTDSHT